MFTPSDSQRSNLLPESTLLHGRYKVHHYLSSGGFGNTYYALDTQLNNKVVAVKEFFVKGMTHREDDQRTVTVSNVINSEQFDKLRRKFHKEAERMANLGDCDHVCSVTDLFEENSTSYYVMQYIDGESLQQRVSEHGPLPEAEIRQILVQMLDALDDIHAKGICHFDIKPGNIMINKKGKAVLIDFGASKIIQDDQEATHSVTSLCYTPYYAPGEQVAQAYDKFGPWTDLYALGATIYYLLTGLRPPIVSDIEDDGADAFKFPPTVSSAMRGIILWLMQPSRKRRPQTAAEVVPHVMGITPSASTPEDDEPDSIEAEDAPDDVPAEYEIDPDTGEVTKTSEAPLTEDKTIVETGPAATGGINQFYGNAEPPAEKPKRMNGFLITLFAGLIAFVGVVGGWWYVKKANRPDSHIAQDSIAPVDSAAADLPGDTLGTAPAPSAPSPASPPARTTPPHTSSVPANTTQAGRHADRQSTNSGTQTTPSVTSRPTPAPSRSAPDELSIGGGSGSSRPAQSNSSDELSIGGN